MPRALTLLLLAALALPAPGEDRLPPGAVARLGDPKFRSAGKAFALAPDGQTIAVAEPDGSVRILDAQTWAERHRLDVPSPPPRGDGRRDRPAFRRPVAERLQFDAQGRRLGAFVQSDSQGYLVVWKSETWEVERTSGDPAGRFDPATAVSADLRRIAWYGPDPGKAAPGQPYALQVWDLDAGHVVGTAARGQFDRVSGIALSADGSRLTAWGPTLFLRGPAAPGAPGFPAGGPPPRRSPDDLVYELPVWDVDSAKEVGRVKTREPVTHAVLSPDGTRVAVRYGHEDERGIWDLAAGKWLSRFVPREGSSPTFFLGNDSVGMVSRGGVFQRRDVATGRLTTFAAGASAEADQFTGAAASLGDGSVRFCGRLGPAFVVWDVTPGGERPARTFGAVDEAARAAYALAFTRDGKTLRTVAENGQVVSWDMGTRRPAGQMRIPLPPSRYSGPDRVIPSLTPDARFVLFPWETSTRIWDIERSLEVATVARSRADTVGLDGRVLDGPGDAQRQVRALKPAAAGTAVLSGTSPDGRLGAVVYVNRAAGVRDQNQLVVFDLAAEKPLQTISITTLGPESRLSFSPDGRCVVLSNWQSVSAWAWEAGRPLFLNSFGGAPIAFSADGRLAGRALADGYGVSWGVMVSEIVTGGLRHNFPISGNGAVAFAPDGRTLAAPTPDGTILLWDLTKPAGADAPKQWDPAEAGAVWTGLADPDAARGFAQMARLLAFPDAAVALLKERLNPTDPKAATERLVRQLDDASLPVREAATRELAALGEPVAGPMRQALAADPTPEVRRRLEFLLADVTKNSQLPAVRPTRAVEVLERIGSPAAREVLEALTKGEPDAVLTREAKAAVGRVKK